MQDNNKKLDTIYSKWIKLGFGFAGNSYLKSIDLEILILESLEYTRTNARLFTAMASWISENFDLINFNRLIKLKSRQNSAILGFIFDTVYLNNKEKSLFTVINNCLKNQNKEIFFKIMSKKNSTSKIEIMESTKVSKKWGYYCRETEFRSELVQDREIILKNNKNLAIRAIIGTNIRSEILYYLVKNKKTYIKQAAEALGLSYFPTYKEFHSLAKNKFLDFEQFGKIKVFTLGKTAQKILKAF